MQRVVTVLCHETENQIVLTCTRSNKKTPLTECVIVLVKNKQEGKHAVHDGIVTHVTGCTETWAARLLSHLAATHQMKPGVSVVV